MTPNPDSVDPDITVIDALRDMHDHKYLHLPVREGSGKVIGVVGVMELVNSATGEGGKGWREFFEEAMNIKGNDSESLTSFSLKENKAKISTAHSEKSNKINSRTVSKLRPKAPIT
eukprot:CAMPEP_0196767158 /NCGR_PEP_ID=MMETSP1095-20130614/36947_1 /TAXON_ID=96789 ORGANISM="Chromulina nebulosa, Strain UTEXLB2642" /NCGR_SAMPLE_ID=MMETSP1095 /ASSEMBLY_ACC=CAM_ASM_000446 /LENGTH=115 /DNA_ID=CAMNT_0042133777 /DNA_START=1 /DNA_END=345 /DNA_ORIENTATION=+